MLKIKEYRIAKSITQEQLAEKVEVSRENISRYETGNRNPPISVLVRIANVLGVSIDDLVGESA